MRWIGLWVGFEAEHREVRFFLGAPSFVVSSKCDESKNSKSLWDELRDTSGQVISIIAYLYTGRPVKYTTVKMIPNKWGGIAYNKFIYSTPAYLFW